MSQTIDVKRYEELARQKQGEHRKFLAQLKKKAPKNLDKIVQQVHNEVFQEIDCVQCANCCKTLGPDFTEQDITRIAKHFRMKLPAFEEMYLQVDEDGDKVFKSMPCPFLGPDNLCDIYDVRPKACAAFPHTDRKKIYQINHLTIKNTLFCPAAYLFVEKLKDRIQKGTVMRRFNAGVITLLIIAAYFIATAFIPDLYLAFNYKLILALLFVLLSWQSKGKFLFFLGMAFLSTQIHDLFRLDYSEWTLFVGILILGIAVDRLSKPSYKKNFSYKVSKEHEREIFAKTLFSESVQVVTSQNLETVYANADFGRLTLDLRQAQFMTDRPQIVVQANFSQVIIRVPKDWQVDTHGLHTSLAGVKGYDSLGERDLSSTTVFLTGSVSFGQVTVKH